MTSYFYNEQKIYQKDHEIPQSRPLCVKYSTLGVFRCVLRQSLGAFIVGFGYLLTSESQDFLKNL